MDGNSPKRAQVKLVGGPSAGQTPQKRTEDSMQTNTETPSAPQGAVASTFSLTEGAVKQLQTVIAENGFEDYVLTIRVMPAGCSGMGYDLNLVKEAKADDLVWEQNGIKMATDANSRGHLEGTQVDYVKGIQGEGFQFSNPNAKSSCGCGTSFST